MPNTSSSKSGSRKRKIGALRPSLENLLKQIAPNVVFTKGAMEGLSHCHLEFLHYLASEMGQGDGGGGCHLVQVEDVAAVVAQMGFTDIADRAMDMIMEAENSEKKGGSASTQPKETRKKKKKVKITDEMLAEQERLLEASKNKVSLQHQAQI